MDAALILNIVIGTTPVIATLIGTLIRTEHRLTRVETKIELIERCVLPNPKPPKPDTYIPPPPKKVDPGANWKAV